MSFDDVLEQRLHNGVYQIMQTKSLSLAYFCNYFIYFYLLIGIPLISNDKGFTDVQSSVLASVNFVFQGVGYYFGSYFDYMGR